MMQISPRAVVLAVRRGTNGKWLPRLVLTMADGIPFTFFTGSDGGSRMLRGSMVALITPMHKDGSLDGEALRRLIDFHVDQGTDAIVAVGTTGESSPLTMKSTVK